MRRLLVAGNWKMNTTRQSATNLARALGEQCSSVLDVVDVLICPPFLYLDAVGSTISGTGVQLGAQNAYFESPGAFTGEVAVSMLLDVGCRWVLVGHSERRHVLGETNELINKKVAASLENGLNVILCVGERLNERESGQTEAVLDSQMNGGLIGIGDLVSTNLVIAYEPVWAIGTGVTATAEQAELTHAYLRNWLTNRYNSEVGEQTRILYGGSVKPENARSLLEQSNVDGALVGGASLKAKTFMPIVQAGVNVSRQ